jgi:hypothetical protein
MFQYICIILREFQSCTSLKFRRFYIITTSLKLSNQNIYVVVIDRMQSVWLFTTHSIIQIICTAT